MGKPIPERRKPHGPSSYHLGRCSTLDQVPVPLAKMLRIRAATINDAELLSALIREFAEFTRELELVTLQPEDLARDGFGPEPRFHALIAELSGETAGYAVYFDYYSTWYGRGLFLEDLYVRQSFRRHGIGKKLLVTVARIAVDQGCGRMGWEVRDWNKPAIEFYRALGAEFRQGSFPVHVSDEALKRLAEQGERI